MEFRKPRSTTCLRTTKPPKKSLWISPVPKVKNLKLLKTNSKNTKGHLQTRCQLKSNWQRLSDCRKVSNKKYSKLNCNARTSNGGKRFWSKVSSTWLRTQRLSTPKAFNVNKTKRKTRNSSWLWTRNYFVDSTRKVNSMKILGPSFLKTLIVSLPFKLLSKNSSIQQWTRPIVSRMTTFETQFVVYVKHFSLKKASIWQMIILQAGQTIPDPNIFCDPQHLGENFTVWATQRTVFYPNFFCEPQHFGGNFTV